MALFIILYFDSSNKRSLHVAGQELHRRKTPSAETNTLARLALEVAHIKQITNGMNQCCMNTLTWLIWRRPHRKVTWRARKKKTALLFWTKSESKAVIYSPDSWAQSHRSRENKTTKKSVAGQKSHLCLPDHEERPRTQPPSHSQTPCDKLPRKDSSNQPVETAANHHTAP